MCALLCEHRAVLVLTLTYGNVSKTIPVINDANRKQQDIVEMKKEFEQRS